MSTEIVKLFSSRSERYPEPTASDSVLGVARAAISSVPVVGGAATELLSMVIAPSVERRRQEWLKELADGLQDLEARFEKFKIGELADNEWFVSAIIQSSRAAINTHQVEKRVLLRNALLNIALERSVDEDQQQIFIRYIDELTIWHVRVLQHFQNPSKAAEAKATARNSFGGSASNLLESVFPDLRGKRDFYDQLVSDLVARGLLDSPNFLHTMMTAQGLLDTRTTALANGFLAFVSDPLA